MVLVESGRFIAGHPFNNPNLPLIGMRLGGPTLRCSKCGSIPLTRMSEEEAKAYAEKMKIPNAIENASVVLLRVLAIVIVGLVLWAIVYSFMQENKTYVERQKEAEEQKAYEARQEKEDEAYVNRVLESDKKLQEQYEKDKKAADEAMEETQRLIKQGSDNEKLEQKADAFEEKQDKPGSQIARIGKALRVARFLHANSHIIRLIAP